ncbi:MnuA family membrane nuclease [Mycoplasmopsis cynos]|uniref:Membrane nuclease MnuA n=1 Tax=Mycoplasmopsis cynos TaxID=171284 RepID=A0A449AJ49_9BACT|nr:hypothetical protein [Mycoplasmopsis cynos]VEU65007.1 Membrane nuclease MnuA [Mycoplasmopsis cynos]
MKKLKLLFKILSCVTPILAFSSTSCELNTQSTDTTKHISEDTKKKDADKSLSETKKVKPNISQSDNTSDIINNNNNNANTSKKINDKKETDPKTDTPGKSKENVEKELGLDSNDYLVFGSWNILNYGQSNKSKKTISEVKITGISEVIADNNLDLVSLQEINYGAAESVNLIKEKLLSDFKKNYELLKSPDNIYSNKYESQKEQFAILYDKNKLTNIQLSTEESIIRNYDGGEFVRPLWVSKFIDKKNNSIYIVDAHLDSPGAKAKAGEQKAGNINGYNWATQGEKEVKEFIASIKLVSELKKKYPDSVVIFNGDTNIKTKNLNFGEQIIKQFGLESGYQDTNLSQSELHNYYASSLGTRYSKNKKGFSEAYDKFIVYDPNNRVDQVNKEDYKYDIVEAFKNKFDKEKYKKLWEKESTGKKFDPFKLVKKVSDHTLVKIKVKV